MNTQETRLMAASIALIHEITSRVSFAVNNYSDELLDKEIELLESIHRKVCDE